MLQFFKKTLVQDLVAEENVDDPVKVEEAQVDAYVLNSEVDRDG